MMNCIFHVSITTLWFMQKINHVCTDFILSELMKIIRIIAILIMTQKECGVAAM